MLRPFALAGALFAGSGVALGAFGAHALAARLEPERLETWETAVFYQLVHGLALLIVSTQQDGLDKPIPHLRLAGGAFIVGVLLFSGSLYLLCLTRIALFGPITPVGGVSLLLGWAALFVGYLRRDR